MDRKDFYYRAFLKDPMNEEIEYAWFFDDVEKAIDFMLKLARDDGAYKAHVGVDVLLRDEG